MAKGSLLLKDRKPIESLNHVWGWGVSQGASLKTQVQAETWRISGSQPDRAWGKSIQAAEKTL